MAGNDAEGSCFPLREERLALDREVLLRIFREEIWHLILNCQTKPADLKIASQSSPAFDDILSLTIGRKAEYLFRDVWDILGRKVHQEELEDWILPYTEKQMEEFGGCDDVRGWYKDILELRLVCRAWKGAIDLFYTCKACLFAHEKEDTDFAKLQGVTPQQTWWIEDVFESVDDLDWFMEHFEQTHGIKRLDSKPFLSGGVTTFN